MSPWWVCQIAHCDLPCVTPDSCLAEIAWRCCCSRMCKYMRGKLACHVDRSCNWSTTFSDQVSTLLSTEMTKVSFHFTFLNLMAFLCARTCVVSARSATLFPISKHNAYSFAWVPRNRRRRRLSRLWSCVHTHSQPYSSQNTSIRGATASSKQSIVAKQISDVWTRYW